MPAVGRGAWHDVPPDLARDLSKAARVGDYDRLSALLEETAKEYPTMAEELRTLLERYAYDEIERRVNPDPSSGARPAAERP